MEAAANHLARQPSKAAARKAVKETATEHLHALDKTFAGRASLLGKAGQVSKAHQAVKDELKARGQKALGAHAVVELDEQPDYFRFFGPLFEASGCELDADGLPVFDEAQPVLMERWPDLLPGVLASGLQFKPGTALWKYWTRGKGFAKWIGSPTPWTTLRALLIKYVGKQAAGLTTNVMLATPAGRAAFKRHHGANQGK